VTKLGTRAVRWEKRLRWPGIEIRHLIALDAVAAEGSFSAAARRLGYTPPAVSQQVSALERILGVRLLVRGVGPTPVSLSEAGRLLLRRSQAIFSELGAVQVELENLHDRRDRILRLGTFADLGSSPVAGFVRRYLALVPGSGVAVETATAEDIPGLLVAGELDVGFVLLPAPQPLVVLETIRDPYVLVTHADEATTAATKPLGSSELRGLPLLTPRARDPELDRFIDDAGLEQQVRLRSESGETLLAAVRERLGAALLPRLLAASGGPEICWRELADAPVRLIGIAASSALDPTVEPMVGTAARETATAAS
jgi:DNA-binding transcriptional LysR family regulator